MFSARRPWLRAFLISGRSLAALRSVGGSIRISAQLPDWVIDRNSDRRNLAVVLAISFAAARRVQVSRGLPLARSRRADRPDADGSGSDRRQRGPGECADQQRFRGPTW